MKKKEPEKKDYLYYKDKPLVRYKDTIYYGCMHDKYIIKLQIKTYRTEKSQTFSDKILIQLLKTDPHLNLNEKIIKTAEKEGLFPAIDLADIWLHKALDESLS